MCDQHPRGDTPAPQGPEPDTIGTRWIAANVGLAREETSSNVTTFLTRFSPNFAETQFAMSVNRSSLVIGGATGWRFPRGSRHAVVPRAGVDYSARRRHPVRRDLDFSRSFFNLRGWDFAF